MEELIPQNRIGKLDPKIRIHQLREPVPVTLQTKFFALVRSRRIGLEEGKVKAPKEKDLIERIRQLLVEIEDDQDDKLMRYFASLACGKEIETLRFIESLLETTEEGYKRYLCLMAELELRMRVYEELTGEPQAILASGLGGVDNLIRLSGLAFQRQFEPWEPYQRELLHQTLSEACEEHGGYIEQEFWGDEYYGFCFLLPYYADISNIIEEFLNECNQYGQFLHPDCHVGNMQMLSHELIKELILFRKNLSSDNKLAKQSIEDMLRALGNATDETASDNEEEN